MKRRSFAVVGGTIVALDVILASDVVLSPQALLTVSLIAAGGLLLVLGGFEVGGERVPWYRFVGAGEVVLGAVFVVAWVPPALEAGASTTQLVLAAVGAVNGLALGFIGNDWFHGGGVFDLSAFEPGPLLGEDESAAEAGPTADAEADEPAADSPP